MKTLYSNTISEAIQYDEAGGSTSKPIVRTQYYDDIDSEWKDFEDVQSRAITLSNQNKRYASWSFVPPSKELSLVLNNFDSVYSTGSGNPKARILKKNLKVRCFSGYELSATGSNSYTDDFSTNLKTYHVWATGGKLYSSIASASGTISKYADFNNYDRFNYDTRTYSGLGYYHKTYELSSTAYDSFNKIDLVTSSNKFSVKWKVDSLGWSPYWACSTGSNSFVIDSIPASKLEYIVRFEDSVWSTASNISSIKVHTKRKGYLFERGTFLCDEPEYGDTVQVKGRDYLKKALETEVNLPAYSSTNLETFISGIFDRCSIPYDTALWGTITRTVTVSSALAESLNNISGWKALDYAMDALNAGDDDWRITTEPDGKLSVKLIPTATEQADYSISYFPNIENISKNFDSDKQLQRITALNKDVIVNSETLIRTLSGTATSSSWGTGALYVRYVDNVGNLASETGRTNTAIDFTFSGTASHNVSIYGCFPKNAITNEVWAERGNALNVVNNDGQTYKVINPLLSQGLCNSLVDYMIDLWGEPAKKIELTMQTNPYLELNDSVVVFDKYTYTDDIYLINEIQESWTEPVLKDTIILSDRGVELGQFIWDRNGVTEGNNDLSYDFGFVWDQDLEIGTSDSNIYQKPTRRA